MILRETEGEQNGCRSGSYCICLVLAQKRKLFDAWVLELLSEIRAHLGGARWLLCWRLIWGLGWFYADSRNACLLARWRRSLGGGVSCLPAAGCAKSLSLRLLGSLDQDDELFENWSGLGGLGFEGFFDEEEAAEGEG